jgi:hypothetical protein
MRICYMQLLSFSVRTLSLGREVDVDTVVMDLYKKLKMEQVSAA